MFSYRSICFLVFPDCVPQPKGTITLINTFNGIYGLRLKLNLTLFYLVPRNMEINLVVEEGLQCNLYNFPPARESFILVTSPLRMKGCNKGLFLVRVFFVIPSKMKNLIRRERL